MVVPFLLPLAVGAGSSILSLIQGKKARRSGTITPTQIKVSPEQRRLEQLMQGQISGRLSSGQFFTPAESQAQNALFARLRGQLFNRERTQGRTLRSGLARRGVADSSLLSAGIRNIGRQTTQAIENRGLSDILLRNQLQERRRQSSIGNARSLAGLLQRRATANAGFANQANINNAQVRANSFNALSQGLGDLAVGAFANTDFGDLFGKIGASFNSTSGAPSVVNAFRSLGIRQGSSLGKLDPETRRRLTLALRGN